MEDPRTLFDYEKAFSRNIGWVTNCEQQALRTKRIAIAGMGGVGGIHLLTLVRLGIENFNIADLDKFDIANFNRQFGANLSTLNQPKAETLTSMAKEINPEVNIKSFSQGITLENIDEFLKDVDLYIDGLDFFELPLRAAVFKRCNELEIPAITAAPLGMSTAYIIFMPGQMSFEKYFCLEGKSPEDQQMNFLIGLNPKAINRHYLMDPTAVDLTQKRGPSTVMSCLLCAGVTGVEALKILLNRGKIYAAPHYHLFDAYFSKYYRGWLIGGNNNPLQKFKRYIIKRLIKKMPIQDTDKNYSTIKKILDLARWTPSGDNHQPWQFEIVNDKEIKIHVHDDAETDVYDFDGLPTLISTGCLLENIKLAATQFSMKTSWQYFSSGSHDHVFTVKFIKQHNIKADPLSYCIKERSVDRSSYQNYVLTRKQKERLTQALGEQFEIIWFEDLKSKLAVAKLNFLSTEIRLKADELYPIHQKVIDTNNTFSDTGLPLNALGLNFFSKKLLRWTMQKKSRMDLMNKLGATFFTGIELDLIPGILCSAHFVVTAKHNDTLSPQELAIKAGETMQCFWLMATQLGLVLQPSFAPIMFRYHTKHQNKFTQNEKLLDKAKTLTEKYQVLVNNDEIMFAGRIGKPKSRKPLTSRSIRKSLDELIIKDDKS